MRILAFPGRLNTKAKAPIRDWSTQEIADFYRAHRLLAENGAGIGIDRGVSDEGEPWMVFFDTATHDVFLHIARIDGTCHLVCEPFSMRLDAADITSLIAQFEHAVRDHLAIRTERAKNVVVHPAARIIMSISAVFLLFKLENGEAYAKGMTDKVGALAVDKSGSEKSTGPLARAQAVFQRAFDAIEAPINAALLAGIILASELALSPLRGASTEAEVEKLIALALVEQGPDLVTADGAGINAVVADVIDHVKLPVAVEIPLQALEVPVPEIADAQLAVQFTPAETVVQVAVLGPVVADFRMVQLAPVMVEAPAENLPDAVTNKPEGAGVGNALEQLFPISPDLATAVTKPVDVVTPPKKVVDISLARLDEMTQEFGFVREMRLSDSQVYRLSEYYKSAMGDHKSDYKSGGQVLIEQVGVDKLAEADLGLVTAILHDGSTHTFVGRADLIDDVLTFFT